MDDLYRSVEATKLGRNAYLRMDDTVTEHFTFIKKLIKTRAMGSDHRSVRLVSRS
jgi:hypothetical protein